METDDVTAEEIWAEIDVWADVAINKPLFEDGWFTASKLARRKKITYDRANDLCNKDVEEGKLEVWVYGRTNYYRVIKK